MKDRSSESHDNDVSAQALDVSVGYTKECGDADPITYVAFQDLPANRVVQVKVKGTDTCIGYDMLTLYRLLLDAEDHTQPHRSPSSATPATAAAEDGKDG